MVAFRQAAACFNISLWQGSNNFAGLMRSFSRTVTKSIKQSLNMKISKLLFLLALVFFSACKDDEEVLPDLRYDGANNSGPLLSAGEHELAVRFPAAKMAEFAGRKLSQVQVYVGPQLPLACEIRIYGQGDDSTPGINFYKGNVISSLEGGAWNKFDLTPAIELTGEDLWISVYVDHAAQQQSIGCDAGPGLTNGDWLFDPSDLEWKPYKERTSESVNWNIRGVVE